MGKNILITGGAGFIGSHTALSLLEDGHDVTILDNLSPQIHGLNSSFPSFLQDKCKLIKGDVRNKEDWIKSLKNIEVICHFAAETGTGQSMYQIQKYSEVSINGTAIMLDVLTEIKHSVEKVILSSSRAIYGEGKYKCKIHGIIYPKTRKEEDMDSGFFDLRCSDCNTNLILLPTDEISVANPTSIYGITKQIQEQLIINSCSSNGLPFVSLRFQNVYGPGQSLKNPYTGILSIFSTLILNNQNINIFEDGKESRDFIFIEDVVSSIKLSLTNEKANYNIFNVGFGENIEVEIVAKSLIKLFKTDTKINISGDYRQGDIRHNYADLLKIKTNLKYLPKISFKQGLRRFVEWVKSQEIQINKFEEAIDEMHQRGLYKRNE
jgi:dTDP-L-rhamnose 4-epimerase